MIKKYGWNLSILAILLVAAFLRLWKLGQVPVSLYWDEMAIYVDVKSVLASGQDMHGLPWAHLIYPSYGDYKLAPYIWAAILASKAFGLSEWSLRLPSVLAGLVTVGLAGLMAGELFSDWKQPKRRVLQLLSMVMVTFMPWSIQFSRTGFEGHLAQAFAAASVWLMLKARRSIWLILPAMVFATAATYTYYSARFVIFPVLLLILVVQFWQFDRAVWRKQVKKLLAKVALIVFGSVLLLYPLTHANFVTEMNRFRLGTDSVLKADSYIAEANRDRQLAGNSIFARLIYHRYWLQLRALLLNFSSHLTLNYLFLSGDPNLRHSTQYFGILLITTMPFLGVGLWWLVRKRPALAILLVGWWLLALLPASVPMNVPHALRSLNGLLPVALILGVGATILITELVPKYVPRLAVKPFWLGYGVLVLINVLAFSAHYFVVYPALSAEDWQAGYKPLAIEVDRLSLKYPDIDLRIFPFDDLFFLWLMGYGHYTAQDFHGWQSKQFSFLEAVPGIHFDPDYRLKSLNQITVGPIDVLKKDFPADSLQIVNNEVGQPTFAIHLPDSIK